MVVKCQSDRTDHNILAQGSVPKTAHEATVGHTFTVVLTREREPLASQTRRSKWKKPYVQTTDKFLCRFNRIHAGSVLSLGQDRPQCGVLVCGEGEDVEEERRDGMGANCTQGGAESRGMI